MQLGTFQPILRLHSNHGNRLPWQYPEPADSTAAAFLRLREALVPYTYSLADEAVNTGLPIDSSLYLDYPNEPAAYSNPDEYLYGPDVLVAPVTKPGAVTTETVWLPPGHWTDYFTGATFTGPSTQTLTVPLNRMPVFVKAGAIIPEQVPMRHVGAKPNAPTILRVYPGPGRQFSLYQDAGTGNGYEHGQSSSTLISTWPGGATGHGNGPLTTVQIGPADGRYPGQPASRSFVVKIERISAPSNVRLDGRHLAAGDWRYNATTHTLTVPVTGLGLASTATLTEVGGSAISAPEPAAVDLSISPSAPLSVSAGAATTVTTTEHNDGPGTATGLSVSLSAPAGWTVTPASRVSGGNLADGSSSSQSWTVTAPAGSSSPVTAALEAQLKYTSAGQPERVTTDQQGSPAPAPLPPPVIDSATPSTTAPGTSVTLNGDNFGSTQGTSYLTLAQPGISWGAPFDGAKLTITSWSNTSITFQLPPDSAPFPLTPGSATITVTVGTQTSAALTLTITGTVGPPPSISAVNPSTTTAGSSVTLTGIELRHHAGRQLPPARAGHDQLGRALRRRQADDQQLGQHFDHLPAATRQRIVPVNAGHSDDLRERRRSVLEHGDAHDHVITGQRSRSPQSSRGRE